MTIRILTIGLFLIALQGCVWGYYPPEVTAQKTGEFITVLKWDEASFPKDVDVPETGLNATRNKMMETCSPYSYEVVDERRTKRGHYAIMFASEFWSDKIEYTFRCKTVVEQRKT